MTDHHEMRHSRTITDDGIVTSWTCESCPREYRFLPNGRMEMIDRGEQLIPHRGAAGSFGFGGFAIDSISSDDPVPDQFAEYLGGVE